MSYKSKLSKLALCGALALSFTVGTMSANTASAKDLRGWNIHVENYPVSHGMEAFLSILSAQTEGRISGKIFHNGVLGGQVDAIEQTRLGAIDFGVFSLGQMGQAIPETNIVSLPFIFKSVPDMYKLMDGEVGEKIGAGMIAKGIVPLGWYDAGARSFYTSKRAVNTPDDIKGLKIRVMNNDLFVGMVEAMGGNGTPMAFGEVFQSIKTGVVDGAENNPPSYESTNHFEVAQFYSLSEHLIIPECLCVSKKTWDTWSAEDQQTALTVGRASANLQRTLWQAREKASMAKVEAGGVAVNTIADKAAFQNAMGPVYDKFIAANPDLAPIIDLIRGMK